MTDTTTGTMPSAASNAGFNALVQHIAALHQIRQNEVALGDQFEITHFDAEVEVIDLLLNLHKDRSYLELLEFNAPGCTSAEEVYAFVFDCVSRMDGKPTMPSAAQALRHLDAAQGTVARTRPSPDDYAVWPDGTYTTIDELDGYFWKSDDYEIVRHDDEQRLIQLGVDL